MERLTEKCWTNLDPWECCGQDRFCGRGCHDLGGCTNGCIVPKLYARLAAYEDAIPLERAQELAQAEKGGRLLLLPCKVGDTVYAITSPINIDGIESEETIDIFECKVESITFYSKCSTQLRLFYQGIFVAVLVTVDDFGRTVFLTREEAEAALKKREADNEAD